MRKKVVTFGEIMLRLGTPGYFRFNQSKRFEASFAGAEANVAVSLANYGMEVEYVSRLPKNEIAEKCIMELREHGVGLSHCVFGGDRLGVLFLETGAVARPSRVIYDRAESSFSMIQSGMIDWENVFSDACWFHWSGITPALSQSAADVCYEAICVAEKMGVTISCDLNFRRNLWNYGKTAITVMPELVQKCHVILGNEEDCECVFGISPSDFDVSMTNGSIDEKKFELVCTQMMKRFPKCKKMVITLRGAINANHNVWSGVLYSDGVLKVSSKYDITHIVDRVGGGDSFMGALIYGLTHFDQDQKALDFAVAASCLKHTIVGDFNRVSIEEVLHLVERGGSGRINR